MALADETLGLEHRVAAALASYAEDLLATSRPEDVPGGTFAIEAFLHRLAAANGTLIPADIETLEKVARKIEVFRHLYRVYDAEIKKPIVREPVDADCLCLLCALYLKVFHDTGDYKFLNTGIKMLEGVLETPDFTPPEDLQELAEALIWSDADHA